MEQQLDRDVVATNLVRIRNRHDLSKKKAAERADVSYRTYLKMENGETNFQLDTLRKVAHALEVKISDLLRPAPRLRTVRFRAGEGLRKRDDIVAQAGIWLEGYNQLEEMLDDHKSARFSEWLDRDFNLPDSAGSARERGEAAAAQVREFFDIKADEPIRDICGLLAANGIKVLPYQTSTDAFFGLSVGAPDGGPLVVVNVFERITVERWIFTAAHELGHIVLHRSSFDVDEEFEDKREEEEANWFASAFLMPGDLFQREWDYTSGLPFVRRVFKLKRMFRVSYQTVLRRLIENREAAGQRDTYRRLYQIWNKAYEHHYGKRIESKTEEPDPLDPSAFSKVYRSEEEEPLAASDFVEEGLSALVRRAFEREMITLSKVAEYLQVSLSEARAIASEWEQERSLGF